METKTFSGTVDLKPIQGRFVARVCSFNIVDKGKDCVQRGAFSASLERWRASNGRIPVCFDHQTSDPHGYIGEINPHNCEERDDGLIVSGELFLDDERGAKTYALLKRGLLREWSYTCLIAEGGARPRANGGRDLLKLDLREVSPTLIGKGTTETLMVASAASPVTGPTGPTVDEQLAPFRARLAVAQARVARAREGKA